ncbi:hypothetical protein [Nonomuraea sp. NPDC050783]|uniref:hypothetical protein n=1 Tax=Nonomuraea sp. NPDC050783 TaxID=3154634 RepID=UPI003465E3C9
MDQRLSWTRTRTTSPPPPPAPPDEAVADFLQRIPYNLRNYGRYQPRPRSRLRRPGS